MRRIREGWRLTKKSWAVVKADRSLAIFPAISAACTVLSFLVVWTGAGAVLLATNPDDLTSDPVTWIAFVLSTYAGVFTATFFNVALASCAVRSLEGADTTVSEGLRAAWQRLGAIAGWSALATLVSVILRLIEERFEAVGSIVAAIVGVAWSAAAFFVVPVLALEGSGPIEALKASGRTVKRRWGESATGYVAISAVSTLAVLCAVAVGGAIAFAGVSAESIALLALGIVVGVGGLIVILCVSSALNQVFRVAVYRYATTDQAPGQFTAEECEHALRVS